MARTENTDAEKLRNAQATLQDQSSLPVGINTGVSPLTTAPGTAVANDEVQPFGAGAAAVPGAADDESIKDDTATASTRWRFRVPGWFDVLWANRKARVGIVM